jgi:hypothetical protein
MVDNLLWPDSWELQLGQKISISSFCFFGEDFASFGGEVEWDEEVYLSSKLPILLKRKNVICGWALDAHFAFWAQWPDLGKGNLLAQYKQIAEQMLVDS